MTDHIGVCVSDSGLSLALPPAGLISMCFPACVCPHVALSFYSSLLRPIYITSSLLQHTSNELELYINRVVINMFRAGGCSRACGWVGVHGCVWKGVGCHVIFSWPSFQCHFPFLVIHKNLEIGDALVKHTLSLLSADTHRCKQREESISVNTFWVCSSRRDLQYDSTEHESARPWTPDTVQYLQGLMVPQPLRHHPKRPSASPYVPLWGRRVSVTSSAISQHTLFNISLLQPRETSVSGWLSSVSKWTDIFVHTAAQRNEVMLWNKLLEESFQFGSLFCLVL